MSIIWSVMIIIAIIFTFFNGSADTLIEHVTKASSNSIENIITLMGMLCFWTGIFNILKHTSLIEKMANLVKPITSLLFKKEEVDDEIMQDVALNVTSNAIGVGNAATVFGINATKKMQAKNKNKEKPNDSMTAFILLNTASIQIIPTTIISLRAMYGSGNPGEIILAVWVASILALVIGIAMIKLLNKVVK